MIDELTLQNVRLFGEPLQSFPLAKLTVLTGTNSSGKSTVLKILPLLRQTQGIGESGTLEDGKLRLKGTQVDLGTFQSLVSNNDAAKTIGIGVTCPGTTTVGFARWLDAIESNTLQQFKLRPEDQEASLYEAKWWFEFVSEARGQSNRRFSVGALSKATFKMSISSRNLFSWRLTRVTQGERLPEGERFFRLTVPKPFWDASGVGKFIRPLDGSEIGEVDQIAALGGILPSIIVAQAPYQKTAAADIQRAGNGEGEETEEVWSRWPLPALIERNVTDLKTALEEINYVGPLRSPGKRFYIADLDVSRGLDPTGEFLPYILRDKGDDKVTNCHMIGSDYKLVEESLTDALNYWLTYFRTADPELAFEEQAEFDLASTDQLVELKLQSQSGTKKFSLEDSGFGYSQLLPVIARGLLTVVGATLVVEQPELHLHPALQVRLASFFMGMARCGKQVIIESHSEHLINAIRVAIAESPEQSFAKLCRIYFLELFNGAPIVHELSVKGDGTFDDIPKSFFGEALELSGRLLRAQRLKR